ncbi:hypothetical protein QAD02_020184 [Eretmocerus hayati]|uniref:Uncharacterized protein n=1 Tax=Eretmocerus hayati TaxID=131215 RepID=A0ACC2PLS3_9HYME|nr:hypothetical protein QAD02_020184 [Eretmocerus hayati]
MVERGESDELSVYFAHITAIRVDRSVAHSGKLLNFCNKLICDCQLTWIWGLRNETKNLKLREGLEELVCLLDASYEPKFDSGEDITRALEYHRSIGYQAKSSVHSSPIEKSQYQEDGYEYDYEDSNLQLGRQVVSDGKTSYVRRLLELKPDLLPCPSTREDAMASEQPSGNGEHGSSSSIFSFVSGSASGLSTLQSFYTVGLVLAGQLLLLSRCSSSTS